LGLGTLVVLGVTLARDLLSGELETVLPEGAPSVFLVDVQPDQLEGVQALCRELGAQHVSSVPVLMARLAAIDGRPVAELVKERGNPNERERAQWSLTREQRVSWAAQLPKDNVIVEGKPWREPGVPEVSAELKFARDLGAKLGSVLRFDIQGVPMEFKLTSLRTVEWRSFSMNFFLMAEPGTLDDAPHFWLTGARLPLEREQELQNRLAARFPNVTTVRVRNLVEQTSGVLAQIALALAVLGGFTAVAGLAILLGGIASSQLKRAREVALLKTLGLTRARIAAMFALEYALSGAVAGVLGAGGAYVLICALARYVLELGSLPSWRSCLAAVFLTVVVSAAGGLVASLRALWIRPIEVLRGQD
jgi:putative ABC transport system permease protein